MTTKKAGKKRGPYKKKPKSEGDSGNSQEQEPLDRFRQGAAASMGKEEGVASEDDVATHNETIDEDRGGQKRIPGTERKGNKKVEAQAHKVQDLQERRREILEEEIAEREKLTEMMQKAGIEKYDLDEEYEVVIDRGDPKAKVHKKKRQKVD